jgi:hypothetical protein
MAIRGKSVRTIRARLRRFCSEAGYSNWTIYVFLANGQALRLSALFARGKARQQLFTTWRRGMPALVRVGIPDAAIRVKNNLRLVYADPKREGVLLTAKIGLPSEVRSGSLAREIKARRLLARVPDPIPLPALIRYDTRHLHWLEEEHVGSSEPSSPEQKVGLFLTRFAKGLYGPFVRSRPVSDSLKKLSIDWPELEEIAAESGTLPISERDATWPVSVAHGDLSPGNMVAGIGGRIFLVDWERFGRGPVAWDLRKLILREERLVGAFLQSLSSPDDIEPGDQMRLVLAMRLVQRRRERSLKFSYMMSHQGRGREQALQLLQAREQILLQRLAASTPSARRNSA